ncbi:hypothetical protein [Streptomyces mirabilis]|uniref:hypothetical protein n=1 Tax=Streptomyces mirabilis TaxID=68239 RepID=UPI0036EA9DBA
MADAIEGSTFRVPQHTAHLAARENPEGVDAEIDAFLAAPARCSLIRRPPR